MSDLKIQNIICFLNFSSNFTNTLKENVLTFWVQAKLWDRNHKEKQSHYSVNRSSRKLSNKRIVQFLDEIRQIREFGVLKTRTFVRLIAYKCTQQNEYFIRVIISAVFLSLQPQTKQTTSIKTPSCLRNKKPRLTPKILRSNVNVNLLSTNTVHEFLRRHW